MSSYLTRKYRNMFQTEIAALEALVPQLTECYRMAARIEERMPKVELEANLVEGYSGTRGSQKHKAYGLKDRAHWRALAGQTKSYLDKLMVDVKANVKRIETRLIKYNPRITWVACDEDGSNSRAVLEERKIPRALRRYINLLTFAEILSELMGDVARVSASASWNMYVSIGHPSIETFRKNWGVKKVNHWEAEGFWMGYFAKLKGHNIVPWKRAKISKDEAQSLIDEAQAALDEAKRYTGYASALGHKHRETLEDMTWNVLMVAERTKDKDLAGARRKVRSNNRYSSEVKADCIAYALAEGVDLEATLASGSIVKVT